MKKRINQLFGKLTGYYFTRSKQDPVTILFQSQWIKSLGITNIVDVGANNGQFATAVRAAVKEKKILSFEPIPEVFEILKNEFRSDSNFEAINCAIGSEDGSVELHVNEFSPVSSILPLTETQKKVYRQTGGVKSIIVSLKTLDSFIHHFDSTSRIFLKIDVQGYEEKVLQGALQLLDITKIVYVECSFKTFYEGQSSFHQIYSFLYAQGFEFRGIGDSLTADITAEPLQVDAIFFNTKFSNEV